MNIVVVDNMRDMAMQLHKQVEQQMLEPDTTKEERESLIKSQQYLGGAIRFMLQAIGIEVERVMSRRQE